VTDRPHRGGTRVVAIREVQRAGAATLEQIADALNERGIETACGGRWHPERDRTGRFVRPVGMLQSFPNDSDLPETQRLEVERTT